jgi:[ribosomal protein S18]-alanine N-acetyltransferase
VQIDPPEPRDLTRIAELASLNGAGFDPATELARDYARLWVARDTPGGVPVGFVLSWRAADEMHLLDVAVAPEARRRGVGRKLVEHVLAHARATGMRMVLLEVRVSNDIAVALYRSAGFVESGVRPGYYSDNDEDALLMRLELSSSSPPPASQP